ncbi:MAG: glycosyltransferase family 4 protein, partial [Tepidisphaeraceae bacterium]
GDLVRSRRLVRRFAVRLHNVPPDQHAYDAGGPAQPLGEMDEMGRALTLKADARTTPTRWALRANERFYRMPLDSTQVVPEVVVRVAPPPRWGDPSACSACYWGRLEPRKGVDTLAAGIAHVRRKFPGFRVIFAGGDNVRAEWSGVAAEASRGVATAGSTVIRRLAATSGCDDAVELVGQMPHDQLIRTARTTSVAVLPSRAETFGLSFIEAMMWGVPCVVSDIAVFRELATEHEHCLFADPNDPVDLAEKVCRVLADPDGAARMARRAYEHVQRFTPERVVPELIRAWLSTGTD